MSTDRSRLDWVELPAGVEAESLWCSLHDGDLRSIRSDRLARTLTMEIEVPHLCSHHGLAEEAFFIELDGVQSARATTWAIWPGPLPQTEGKSRDEQRLLVGEYQANWREESVGWDDFEMMFIDGSLDIGNAEAARGDQAIGLRISGVMKNERVEDRAYEFTLRASQIVIRQGQAANVDFDRFVQLGEDYWEAWSDEKI